MPKDSVQGYNVYRVVEGSPVLLTTTPQLGACYADMGLVNGTSYEYLVTAINLQGQEGIPTSSVSVIPIATAPTLNWNSAPTSVSGHIGLMASLSSGGILPAAVVLVDGQYQGAPIDPDNQTSTEVQVALNTTSLTNGNHVVQVIGYIDSSTVCSTPPLTISVINNISNVHYDDVVQPYQNQPAGFDCTFPTMTQWSAVITNPDGTLIRSWQGSSASAHFTWDGRDSSGSVVVDDNYNLSLTTQPVSNGPQNAHTTGTITRTIFPFDVILGSPQALGLITETSIGERDPKAPPYIGPSVNDLVLATSVRAAFKNLQRLNPLFTNHVFTVWVGESTPQRMKDLAKSWLATTVIDLYIYGHGMPPRGLDSRRARLGSDVLIWPTQALPHKGLDDWIIPDIIKDMHPYHFVFLDVCCQAGGEIVPDQIQIPDYIWATAFNIYGDPVGGFLGWDGESEQNALEDGTTESYMLHWRELFWRLMGTGSWSLYNAAKNANTHTPASPEPEAFNPSDVRAGIAREQLYWSSQGTYLP